MAYPRFMEIVRKKFPHEIIRFSSEAGRWFAYLKGGVRISGNGQCNRLLVEGNKKPDGYKFHAMVDSNFVPVY